MIHLYITHLPHANILVCTKGTLTSRPHEHIGRLLKTQKHPINEQGYTSTGSDAHFTLLVYSAAASPVASEITYGRKTTLGIVYIVIA